MKGKFLAAVLAGCGAAAMAQQAQKPQVLFSGPPKTQAQADASPAQASKFTDEQRRVLEVTGWDIQVHLTPKESALEAHALVTLRNNGGSAAAEIPLQLSSSLHFESIGTGGTRIPYTVSTINSDADHTGQLVEADVHMPKPLEPGSQITLEADYGGEIPLTGRRLLAIGAPDANAAASDWDRISADFTGLRGFGNVAWYPVVSVPAMLGDGAKLFNEIGRQKVFDQSAMARLRLVIEFFNQPPNVAILDGHSVTLDKPLSMPTASFPGVITATLPPTRVGFDTLSIFLARRTAVEDNGVRVLATDADASAARNYTSAAGLVAPLVKTWLGTKPHDPALILDLPEADDAPAETGNVLATPLTGDSPQQLAPVVVHALAHAEFYSPRAWLNEGVASFLGNLWIEATSGHTAAMENLNAGRPALAIAEPASPGQAAGEDLDDAESPVYYRTKATYVLWMLRDIAGDQGLQAALQEYRPEEYAEPKIFEHLLEQTSGRDLGWFFSNWVYEDRGLPDLSITGVYPKPEVNQAVLVAVGLANNGNAEAMVPVTVKGADAEQTDWVRVPAHGSITHRVLFQEPPTEVDVNDGTIPEVADSVHRKMLVSAAKP